MMKHIVILGGGISGLAIAWYLQKKTNARLTIIEKSDRVGGWIQTQVEKDFLFELGPRGFRPTGKGEETLALVKALGLEKELISANPDAKKRYLSLNGKLRPFSPLLLMRHGLLRGLIKDWKTPPSVEEDETISQFFFRRFNKEITETFIDPMVAGIFGGNPEQLSIRSCFPKLWKFDQENGSLVRGIFSNKKNKEKRSPLYSFKDGMETLTKRLDEKLKASILLETPVLKIEKKHDHFSLIIPSQVIKADIVISTLPGYALAELMPATREALKDIPYKTISTLNMGWNRSLLKKRGFGFLIPSKEKEKILGMTWDSQIFPQQSHKIHGQTRICVMMDGDCEIEKLFTIAQEGVKKYLGIQQLPEAYILGIAKNAIPQYTLGHEKRLNHLLKLLPSNFYLLGNSFHGVGVNDCISEAKKIAESIALL